MTKMKVGFLHPSAMGISPLLHQHRILDTLPIGYLRGEASKHKNGLRDSILSMLEPWRSFVKPVQ